MFLLYSAFCLLELTGSIAKHCGCVVVFSLPLSSLRENAVIVPLWNPVYAGIKMISTVHLEKGQTSIQTSLCSHCQSIFTRPHTLQLLASETGLRHARKERSILRTAIDGCRLCRELLCMPNCTERDGKKTITFGGFHARRPWPVQAWQDDLKKLAVRRPLNNIFSKDRNLRFCWKGDLQLQRHLEVSRLQTALLFEIAVVYGDAATSSIPNTLPNGNVTCQQTYESIVDWLVTCDRDHVGCRGESSEITTSNGLPAMVLDVSPLTESGPDMIKLHLVAGRQLKYAALSYCWGTTQPNATRTSNIQRHLVQIDISSLPQTLQDAVFVTRKLGLRYLWVDSMCIVQDSDDDKAHEIGRMEMIYTHAYITISASSALDCDQGFLQQRTVGNSYLSLPFQLGANSMTEVALGPIPYPGSRPYSLGVEPIHHRAWTFQESFMSRRILIYGKYQLYWTCAVDWGKEGGNISRRYYHHSVTGRDNFSGLEASHHVLQCPTAADWKSIVVLYSSKKLGDPQDKMPAISSIASFFARKMNDTYLAGLWSKSFRELLCWKLLSSTRPLTRSPCWRAPSWSFYSVDGPLSFESNVEFEPTEESSNPLVATIVSCDVTPASPQVPFGRISSATLVMRGRLVQVEPSRSPPLYYNWAVRPCGTNQDIGRIAMDTLVQRVKDSLDPLDPHTLVKSNYRDWTWSQPIWFFMLGMMKVKQKRDRSLHRVPCGLGLARLPNGNFHRIGFARCSLEGNGMEIFLKQRPEIITIV